MACRGLVIMSMHTQAQERCLPHSTGEYIDASVIQVPPINVISGNDYPSSCQINPHSINPVHPLTVVSQTNRQIGSSGILYKGVNATEIF